MPDDICQLIVGTLAVAPSPAEADGLLAALARGKDTLWPEEWRGRGSSRLVLDRIDFHGLSGLLTSRSGALASWPADLAGEVRDRAKASAMWELAHVWLLAQLTEALAAADVDALLLKGSALGYSLYPDAMVRERGDSDLLVRDRDKARSILTALGFKRREGNLWPEAQRYQELWGRRSEDGTNHSIDLHFDLFNSPVLARMVPFDRAWAGRQALPAIGRSAWAPALPMLLFHACIHRETNRVARYFIRGRETTGADRLIWLIDIDLLARAMAKADWDAFLELVRDTRQARACAAGLDAASRWLGAAVPADVATALGGLVDESSDYLSRGALGRALADVAAVPGLAARLGYARARLFPKEPDLLKRRALRLAPRRRGPGGG